VQGTNIENFQVELTKKGKSNIQKS